MVALFVAIVYFTTNIISYEQSKDVQELIDARVEEALKEATTTLYLIILLLLRILRIHFHIRINMMAFVLDMLQM